MIQVTLDQQQVKEIITEQVQKAISEINQDLVYWDSKELTKRTCMSWNTIQEHFFHEKDFPKFKIGGKWYFPVTETREYLERWIRSQGRY